MVALQIRKCLACSVIPAHTGSRTGRSCRGAQVHAVDTRPIWVAKCGSNEQLTQCVRAGEDVAADVVGVVILELGR